MDEITHVSRIDCSLLIFAARKIGITLRSFETIPAFCILHSTFCLPFRVALPVMAFRLKNFNCRGHSASELQAGAARHDLLATQPKGAMSLKALHRMILFGVLVLGLAAGLAMLNHRHRTPPVMPVAENSGSMERSAPARLHLPGRPLSANRARAGRTLNQFAGALDQGRRSAEAHHFL
jgi:hypothetical protein